MLLAPWVPRTELSEPVYCQGVAAPLICTHAASNSSLARGEVPGQSPRWPKSLVEPSWEGQPWFRSTASRGCNEGMAAWFISSHKVLTTEFASPSPKDSRKNRGISGLWCTLAVPANWFFPCSLPQNKLFMVDCYTCWSLPQGRRDSSVAVQEIRVSVLSYSSTAFAKQKLLPSWSAHRHAAGPPVLSQGGCNKR